MKNKRQKVTQLTIEKVINLYEGGRSVKLTAFCPAGLGEQISATQVGKHLYRISEPPLDIPGLNYLDIVVARREQGCLKVTELVAPSGYEAKTIIIPKHRPELKNQMPSMAVVREIEPERFRLSVLEPLWPGIVHSFKEKGIRIERGWPKGETFRG